MRHYNRMRIQKKIIVRYTGNKRHAACRNVSEQLLFQFVWLALDEVTISVINLENINTVHATVSCPLFSLHQLHACMINCNELLVWTTVIEPLVWTTVIEPLVWTTVIEPLVWTTLWTTVSVMQHKLSANNLITYGVVDVCTMHSIIVYQFHYHTKYLLANNGIFLEHYAPYLSILSINWI